MKALSFEGSGFEYFKIWIVNILLVIVTLGIYYPWAKVRNKRYFYANSTLEGRNFEYHATGKQLFISYLIAMALLIVYIIIQKISPIGSLLVILALFLSFPWIIWRSLMFNMRMTSFSNVRFSFCGALGKAYINFLLLPIAFFLALYAAPIGIAVLIPLLVDSMNMALGILLAVGFIAFLVLAFYLMALMKKKNNLYTINGSCYGQGHFSAQLETGVFAKIMLKTFGLSILISFASLVLIAIIAALTVGIDQLAGFGQVLQEPQSIEDSLGGSMFAVIGLTYAVMICVMLFIVAYSHARQRTYILANTMLDDKIAFASTLTVRSLAWVMISNLLITILTAGLAHPWAHVRIVRLILENTLVDTDSGFDQYVSQQQKEQSALGEEIGDAFDVGLGIGI